MICRRAHRGESGETLIEILMTIVIVGLVFTAILGAMAMNTVASTVHRNQADAESVLLSAAERVKSADNPYIACVGGSPGGPITDPNNAYLQAARSVPLPGGPVAWTSSAIAITDVGYEFRDSTGTSFTSTCYDSVGLTMQLITLTVTSPGSKAIESISVVKENHS